MRTFIGILAGLSWVWVGIAQGHGDTPCTQCVCVAENTCAALDGCGGSQTNCNSVLFTANCSFTYKLKYELTCAGGEAYCGRCYACAFILRESDGALIGAEHGDCTASDCSGVADVPLTEDVQYRLVTCLRQCGDYDCRECAGCVARAYVYLNPSDCNPMPPCNP